MIMKFEADLGTWERGICVTFEASSNESALEKANELLSEEIAAKTVDGGDALVVQIRDASGNAIFDYMNGFYNYENRGETCEPE